LSVQPVNYLMKRLWRHIPYRRKLQFFWLLILMLAASIAEVISISAVLPFLGVITSPDKVFNYHLAKPFIIFFSIESPSGLLLPLTIAFVMAAILAGGVRTFLMWAQTRLSFEIGAELSVSMYEKTLYQPYLTHISRNSSSVISGIITKSTSLVGNAIYPVLNIIGTMTMALMILVALSLINFAIAFVSFVGFGIINANPEIHF